MGSSGQPSETEAGEGTGNGRGRSRRSLAEWLSYAMVAEVGFLFLAAVLSGSPFSDVSYNTFAAFVPAAYLGAILVGVAALIAVARAIIRPVDLRLAADLGRGATAWKGLILAGLGSYVGSMLLTAFEIDGSNVRSIPGFDTFRGASDGQLVAVWPAWLANPLLWIALVLVVRGLPSSGAWLASAALAIVGLSLLVPSNSWPAAHLVWAGFGVAKNDRDDRAIHGRSATIGS